MAVILRPETLTSLQCRDGTRGVCTDQVGIACTFGGGKGRWRDTLKKWAKFGEGVGCSGVPRLGWPRRDMLKKLGSEFGGRGGALGGIFFLLFPRVRW